MALLGRPKAGEITRAQLRIRESKEFKVSEYFISIVFKMSDLTFSSVINL